MGKIEEQDLSDNGASVGRGRGFDKRKRAKR